MASRPLWRHKTSFASTLGTWFKIEITTNKPKNKDKLRPYNWRKGDFEKLTKLANQMIDIVKRI